MEMDPSASNTSKYQQDDRESPLGDFLSEKLGESKKSYQSREITIFINGNPLDNKVKNGIVHNGALLITSNQDFAIWEEEYSESESLKRVVSRYNARNQTRYSFHEILGREYYENKRGIAAFGKIVGATTRLTQEFIHDYGYAPHIQCARNFGITPILSPLDIYISHFTPNKSAREATGELSSGTNRFNSHLDMFGMPASRSPRKSLDSRNTREVGLENEYIDIVKESLADDYIKTIKSLRGTYGFSKNQIAEIHEITPEMIDVALAAEGTSFKKIVHEIMRETMQGRLSEQERERIDTIPLYDESILREDELQLLYKRYFPKGKVPTLKELALEEGVTVEGISRRLDRIMNKLSDKKRKELSHKNSSRNHALILAKKK